ncbi:MAG: AEC family transporter [Balneolaceae bacterium]|nr:AEC family transporter [Balneolaceae bacterium]
MVNILLVIVCLLLGLLLQMVKEFPANAAQTLNQFVIYISLPALALIYIPRIEIDLSLLYPILTSWLVLFLAMLVIPLLGKVFDWDRKTVGCLIMTAGFGNTSFVGFPVIEALYGTDALKYALLVDQPGSFVAITTMGTVIASVYSSGATRKRVIARKILLFPPFITFIVALFLNVADVQAEAVVLGVLEPLGATITPLALISVGLQLHVNMGEKRLLPLVFGLGYKLILAPLTLYLLYVVLFNGSGMVITVSIMEAAMAPMVLGSIIAASHGLNPRLATLMVGIGVPVSFGTLALWFIFLGWAL